MASSKKYDVHMEEMRQKRTNIEEFIDPKADTIQPGEKIAENWKPMCKRKKIFGIAWKAIIVCVCLLMAVFVFYAWTNMITKSDMEDLVIPKQVHSDSLIQNDFDGNGKNTGGSILPHYLNIGMRSDYRLQECQGSQFKQTFPDVDYAFLGYNILKGFPNAVGHDPGFTFPIFTADYSTSLQTSDCKYSIPKGLVIMPDVSCVTSFSSETIQTKYELAKSLAVSASVNGGGWGVSFSASAGYKESSSEISTGESVYILSTAKCLYYFSKFVEDKSPSFSEHFRDWVYKLDSTDMQQTYFDFFEIFGTHFPTYIKFGSKYTYEHKMSSKAFQSKREQGVNVNVQASYSGLFSVGGGFSLDSSQQQAASEFSKSVETKTITVGAPPPANGDAMTWASNVKESPVPMQYKLKSIEHLFTEKYMKSINVDYKKIAQHIKDNKFKYCSYLKTLGQLDSCESLSPGILLGNTRLYNHYRSKLVTTFGECIDVCLKEFRCEAVTFCKSCSEKTCFMYTNVYGGVVLATESREGEWESVVFVSKIENSLKVTDAKITGVPRSSETETQSISLENDCKNLCESDAHCVAYTFWNSQQKIRCELFAENRINGLKKDTGSFVRFIPYRQTVSNTTMSS